MNNSQLSIVYILWGMVIKILGGNMSPLRKILEFTAIPLIFVVFCLFSSEIFAQSYDITIGSTFSVTASTGGIKPKVYATGAALGLKKLCAKVDSFSADTINCTWNKKAAADSYDLYVSWKSGGTNHVQQICSGTFVIHNPSITTVDPDSGAAGTEITLTGLYFGTKKPKVQLFMNSTGKKKTCKLNSYNMTEIRFNVPAKYPVVESTIHVKNSIGEATAAFNGIPYPPPSTTVKLIFIHHSCGQNWIEDSNGGLGISLMNNNYFVSDTNYGWGPADTDAGYENIGDHTDIGQWYSWFAGPNAATYLSALYTEYGQNSTYSRISTDPGGENEIIMFKSCFPNSQLGGSPDDPPTEGDNPLRGQNSSSEFHTVANAKGIYNDILAYFATRQDKLFVVITAPPLRQRETDAEHAANARAFNDWLVNDWLTGYTHNNVVVFDFYNVLTSNGGNTRTNDLGVTTGNHHRYWNNAVQYIHTVSNNYSSYPSNPSSDSHPTQAGNQKAAGEFVALLNYWYHRWQTP